MTKQFGIFHRENLIFRIGACALGLGGADLERTYIQALIIKANLILPGLSLHILQTVTDDCYFFYYY